MKKNYRYSIILVSFVVALAAAWGIYRIVYNKGLQNDIKTTTIDTKIFRPYILGTNISFAKGGNSSDFVKISDGWGGQEPKHRCAVGAQTVIRLYIPDSQGGNLRLTLDGFGVYPYKTEKYQEVTVFANDVKIAVWQAAHNGPFNVDIPTDLIKDNTLTIRFVPRKPYSPPPDTRKLSMAVREIKIDRVFGAQTKRKIGKWVKENLMGGGIKQNFDTNISKDDAWL